MYQIKSLNIHEAISTLEILPLLMLNCPLGCQQQPMVLGVGLVCTGAPGMDPSVPSAAGGRMGVAA